MLFLFTIACGEETTNSPKDVIPSSPTDEINAPTDEIDCEDSEQLASDDQVGDDIDENCDGHDGIDSDGDGFASISSGGDDCDDTNPQIYTEADEVCDEIDNNCNGLIDDEDENWDQSTGVLSYADVDGDGFGDPSSEVVSCTLPEGNVENSDDCNDSSENGQDVFPGNLEICDGLDNDCNGNIDDGDDNIVENQNTYYEDLDGDGFGSSEEIFACAKPDGASHQSGDCDDENAEIYPNALEICDGIDNDCDELIDNDDEVDPASGQIYYEDLDDDGFGNAQNTLVRCSEPVGYVLDNTDCVDDPNLNGNTINPDADEVCDEIDNNCDNIIDDDAIDRTTYYPDSDGDGHAAESPEVASCVQPVNHIPITPEFDCDDNNNNVYVGADEICDGIDNDCDELVDDDDTVVDDDMPIFYLDGDGDGFGSDVEIQACQLTFANSGSDTYVTNTQDCDDTDITISPNGSEVCDGIDNDCDELIDDNDDSLDASTQNLLYLDGDEDGLGDPSSTLQTCLSPQDPTFTDVYIENNLDCDDNDPTPPSLSNFFLEDVNPHSPSTGAIHSLCDYFDQVSGWYFLHAT